MLRGAAGCNAFRLGLMALVAMHAYWYYLFLRILHKLIKGVDAHEAGADEYEGASDDESSKAELRTHKNGELRKRFSLLLSFCSGLNRDAGSPKGESDHLDCGPKKVQ